MATKKPSYPQEPSAPEYSQLPEVAAPWFAAQAPEVVNHDAGDTNKQAGGFVTGMPPSGIAGNWAAQQQPPPFPSSNAPLPTAYRSEPQESPTPGAPKEASPFNYPVAQDGRGPRRTILVLSIVVGILAAAVVGLAAATGLMAKRANDAESANPQAVVDGSSCPLQTATTTTTSTATAIVASPTDGGEPVVVPVVDVSNGCGKENEDISGTTYTTRIFNSITFMRHCNFQLAEFPMYGMLTPDFEACMDACAAWTYRGKQTLGEKHSKAVCGGVRFVPAWTDKTVAYNTNARGNCFLHTSPQKTGDLRKPDLKNGVTSHAAIVINK